MRVRPPKIPMAEFSAPKYFDFDNQCGMAIKVFNWRYACRKKVPCLRWYHTLEMEEQLTNWFWRKIGAL